MTTKTPTLLGGAMIIAGTIIGAGMLANPTATSGVWFIGSLAVLLYTWFSMLASGLMILEANTHYPVGASFDTIVRDSLGKGWNIVNGLGVAFVLYLLTYAYIFVGGRLTTVALGFNPDSTLWIGQLAFFIIFAGCVWYSARLVDRLSSILIGGMVITFYLGNRRAAEHRATAHPAQQRRPRKHQLLDLPRHRAARVPCLVRLSRQRVQPV